MKKLNTHLTRTTTLLVTTVAFAFVARGEDKNPIDEAARVLAEKDKEKGAVSVGKDPAFILMPRPVERNESAQELMTPQVKAMIEKALAYLKTTQASDGSWSDGADFKSNTGVTAPS